jgi:hypothetical protein
MKTARMRSGLLALLVLVAAMAACTNSEQLNSGVGPVPIEITIVNSETRFDRAFFDVTQVTVRPLDPDASEALGRDPLWMIQTTDDAPIEINLNSDQDWYESSSQLTIGPYELISIDMRLVEFTNGQRLGNATCAEYVTQYPLVEVTRLVDFGGPIVIDVTIGAGNQLEMVFDGAAMATAFENSFLCGQGLQCGLFPPMDWCLISGFNQQVFAQQTTTFLSFP